MKKILLFIFCSVAFSSIFGLTVKKEEIEKGRPVNFQNYQGRVVYRVDVNEINRIGRELSRGLKKNDRVQWNNKYTLTRFVDEKNKEKFDADILSIDKESRINHVVNIWRILASYLREEFQYSEENSLTLAKFITYYNAVYRGDTGYFKEMYTGKVAQQLSAQNAGMALRYTEWPGRTKIVIPLSQSGRKIDSDIISDDKVIDNLRKKEDKSIDDRKKIIEIKKDELKKEQNKTETDRKKLEEEKKQIENKKEEIKKEQEKLENQKKQLDKIQDEKKKEELKKEIDKEQKKLDDQKNQTDKREEQIDKKDQQLDKKEQENRQKQENTDKQEQELKKDIQREEMKKNPDKLIDELEKKTEELKKKDEELDRKLDKVNQGKMYYLKVNQYVKDGHYENDMLIIDPISRKVSLKSPVKQIDGHKFDLLENGVVVIVHNNNVHHLVVLDKDQLNLVHKSAEDVFWRSFIEIRDNHIYAIIKKNNGYVLGKFDLQLKLLHSSQTAVDEDSTISFFQDFIYVNRQDKTIIVIKKEDLSYVDTIKP